MKKSLLIAFLLLVFSLSATAQSRFSMEAASWTASAKMTSRTEGVITITATIAPKFHIYGTELPDGGPIPTSITIEGEGLKLLGKLLASPEPEMHHDMAFGLDLPVWHSGKVTFSRRFKVDTKKKLGAAKVTITFMGCSGMRCNEPKTETIRVAIPEYAKTSKK